MRSIAKFEMYIEVEHMERKSAKQKIKAGSVRKEVLRERTSAISLSQWVRHPKEGRFNSHRVNPRFPPSAPMKAAHACQCLFWVQQRQGGIWKAFCIGGVLYNEDTRVETANVNGFFINRLKWTAESLWKGKAHLPTQASGCTHNSLSETLEEVSQHSYHLGWKRASIRQNGTGKYAMHSEYECKSVANRLALFLGMVV